MNSKSPHRREKEKTSSPSIILKCSLCKYSTDKSANLNRHYKTMHETMKTLVQCCGLSFSNKADYRNHNKATHAHGHSCLVCHRNFSRRALLRRHLSVHTGFREFQCPFIKCNYGSSHKSNLTRHMRIHGINTSLKTSGVLQIRQQQQKQRFQPDSTTKISPLKNMKTLQLSHLSPTHDFNNNNNNNTSTYIKNNSTTTTTSTSACSTQSKDGLFHNVLSTKSDKILRRPKATTTTISKKRLGPNQKTKIKLSHSIEAILSRDDQVKMKESKFKSNPMPARVLEDVKIIMMPMPNFEEVTSTTSPVLSPRNNNTEGREIEQEKEPEQQQPYHNGNSASYYNDYYFHINNNTNIIQSQQKVQETKSFQSSYSTYSNKNNNYYYSSAQYHHLPLINNTPTPGTASAPAICSSCDYLTPIYNSSSSLPMSSMLPLQSPSTLSSLSTSYVRPHEAFSNNSAFHSTFGDFNPSITQLRTNGQISGQDSRILPIFHSPYAVPIPLPSSTSCYYQQQTFQPQVVVSDSFTPLTLAPPSSSSSSSTTTTLTSTATVYNSHQNHHLSSPGPSSSDSYGSSPYTLMSFARVSNYQPIEFVSY